MIDQKKRFRICINIPVHLEVVGEERNGDVRIVGVCGIELPSVTDIHDALTDDALDEIDKAFAEAEWA